MMSRLFLVGFAFRMFKRDWKRGDLIVLLFAICTAMASISVIYLIIDRIESATERNISDVLGADLVISSPTEIPQDWLAQAHKLGLEQASTIEFSSVLFANEKLQLASIKAVSENYPLKGRIEIADTPYGESKIVKGQPSAGEIWVEPRIFNLLQLEKNKSVELGYTHLITSGVIMLKPGQSSTLFNIAPAALMNIDDVESTQVIQPGSRINYQYLFAGSAQQISDFSVLIKPQITTSQRLLSIFEESPIAGSAISRSKKYIALSSLLTMILLGVTIAMSANRYARRQFDMSALMRCFGMNNRQVLTIFGLVLSFVAVFGTLIGSAVGIILQEVIVQVFSSQFEQVLPSADLQVLLLPILATVLLLFGFALPAFLQIKGISPMRVLRRQLAPVSIKNSTVYLISFLSLAFVMWLQMGDLKLLLSVLIGLVLLVLIFAFIAGLMLYFMKNMARTNSAAVNFSLRQLDANKGVTLLHLMAFSITLFVIALVILVRTELLSKWQQSLGDNIPNHFLVNVKADEVESIRSFLTDHQLAIDELYPMIRGRIVGVNNQDIKTAISAEGQEHNSLKRELNITWTDNLPVGNKIVEGNWNWEQAGELPQISIEQKTAEALGLKLGDSLDFTIGAEPWSAVITSIRSLDWQTFTPNFYVIAQPDSLSQFSATYIGSFYLPGEKKKLLADMIKSYPSVTVIELDLILKEVQKLITNVSNAIEFIMFFVVLAGLGLLWAAMEHTFDNKYRQSAILRTLGGSKSFIARSFQFEYLWMALLSSSMAILAIELITYVLYQQIFEIEFQFHWALWWSLPLATTCLMLVASWKGVKKVTQSAPLSLIQQE